MTDPETFDVRAHSRARFDAANPVTPPPSKLWSRVIDAVFVLFPFAVLAVLYAVAPGAHPPV